MNQRKAASLGMIEAITGFLADNALTRSWRETMDRYVIGPVERMVVSDEDMLGALAGMIGSRLPVDGRLSDEQIRVLSALKGGDIDVDLANQILANAESRDMKVREAATLARNTFEDSFTREKAVKAAVELTDGRTGLTEFGDDMRQHGLGSPVAAYSAVTAGGAMGTAAAMEAYDWWQSQQQQAEKEKQLPLDGGAAL